MIVSLLHQSFLNDVHLHGHALGFLTSAHLLMQLYNVVLLVFSIYSSTQPFRPSENFTSLARSLDGAT